MSNDTNFPTCTAKNYNRLRKSVRSCYSQVHFLHRPRPAEIVLLYNDNIIVVLHRVRLRVWRVPINLGNELHQYCMTFLLPRIALQKCFLLYLMFMFFEGWSWHMFSSHCKDLSHISDLIIRSQYARPLQFYF